MIRAMVADIGNGRGLAWRLFVRNMRAQYRQTLLGFVWVLVPPVATTALWVILKSHRVINFSSPNGVPYLLYVLCGTILWGAFMGSVRSPTLAISSAREMLGKLRFPREALLMTQVGHVLFSFLLQLLLLLVVLLCYRHPVSSTAVLFPLGVIALMLLGLSIGLVLTPIGMLYKDVGRAIDLCGRFWMFLTPVVYQPLSGRTGEIVSWVNPVAPVLTVTRDWLLAGNTAYLPGFVVFGAAGMLLTIAGLLAMRLTMPVIIERA